MKEFYFNSKALYFTKDNYGVNVFFNDLFKGRGAKFFFTQLSKGLRLLF